ncbi:hypothetical protein B0H69_000059 [Clostridium beijerinckii]|nr:hypothetical protein [Clostridium beijerinckii]NYC05849.1 hypothetical protein [Clostridium beijerinckii]NYC50402.1 hypothetical protein [Clostridium beijerinckii]
MILVKWAPIDFGALFSYLRISQAGLVVTESF